MATILHRFGKRTGCKTCACPNCHPDNRNRQWDATGNCAECGKPSLEWVATEPMRKRANGSMGWGGLRLVPFGTDDLSGTVHPTGYKDCPGNTAPVAMPAPVAKFDDSVIQSRLDAITKRLDTLTLDHADAPGASAEIDALRTEYADLATAIGEIGLRIDGTLADVSKRLDDAFAARPIEFHVPNLPAFKPNGRVHNMVANVAAMVFAVGDAGIVMAVGEAGSGKSTMAHQVAEILGCAQFEADTFTQEMGAIDVLGYQNVNGDYVPSKMRKIYESGGLYFMDEFPRASGMAAASVNGATANGQTGFPDATVTRAKGVYFLAAGNTFGRGMDSQYIDGGGLDGATLSRIAYVPFNTDWGLVAEITGLPFKATAPEFPAPGAPRDIKDATVQRFAAHVQSTIEIMEDIKSTALITSRTAILGTRMLTAGLDAGLVYYSVIWAHMSADDALTVQSRLGINTNGEAV
jgi:hypothetical protein